MYVLLVRMKLEFHGVSLISRFPGSDCFWCGCTRDWLQDILAPSPGGLLYMHDLSLVRLDAGLLGQQHQPAGSFLQTYDASTAVAEGSMLSFSWPHVHMVWSHQML